MPAVEIRDLAVADEPQAALVGRQVLIDGGNAADAAVAMALTMTVTLPSRVGLGGGGFCLVHDPAADGVEAWTFLPPAAGGVALPSMLRGLFAVQGAYGRDRWAPQVARTENLARFGAPISRVLAQDLAVARAHPDGRAELAQWHGPDGTRLGEGDLLSLPAYAETLSRLRGGRIGLFYDGPLADAYAADVAAAGLSIDRAAIADFRPQRIEPAAVEFGRDMLYFAAADVAAGLVQADLFAAFRDQDYPGLSAADRLALLATGLSGTGAAVPGASAVALSADEMAVACGFTLGDLFGTGRVAERTGILIGAPLPPGTLAHGGAALLVNQPLRRTLLAAAGADAAAALAVPLAERLLTDALPSDAMAAPRLGPLPGRPALAVEDRAGSAVLQALATPALATRPATALGRGLLIDCVWNRGELKTCRGVADPRGRGLAAPVGG